MALPSSNSFRPSSLRPPPRTALNEGTVVVYFGREKTLNDIELYKFNFYQSKFDRLVEDQKAKEAIEVMIASESEIQMSLGQAISLLSSLAAQIFGGILRAKSESSVEPMVKSAAAMLRGHTLWHLTPSRTMKVDVERQIAKAERTLREKWQNVERRHILLEIQPFFTYSLNATLPTKTSPCFTRSPDFDERCDSFFERLTSGASAVDSAMLLDALDSDWEMKVLMGV